MDNLESDNPSLVAVAKRLKIMISDKDAHSTMFSIINTVIMNSLGLINKLRVIGKTKTV